MLIVADENIPLVEQAAADWGELRRLPGSAIRASDVVDADVLLVRSVTRVDEALLAGSRLQFVGSATIGADHVDTHYLDQRGIGFANAPGCNANAVVDYVMSSIFAVFSDCQLKDACLGIVGYGNVGSRLAWCCQKLGVEYVVFDPYIDQPFAGKVSRLADALDSTVVSLHVPLTLGDDSSRPDIAGGNPTWHLLNADNLAAMHRCQLLINSSRGAVVDNAALLSLLQAGSTMRAVLDVWEGEPSISESLWRSCQIGTPHIAGYSAAGKLRGAQRILEAASSFLDDRAGSSQARLASAAEIVTTIDGLSIGWTPCSEEDVANIAAYRNYLSAAYSSMADARLFQALVSQQGSLSSAFESMRRNYVSHRGGVERKELIYQPANTLIAR